MSVSVNAIARLFAAAGALALASSALADTKKDKDAPAKPALVASYGDWSVYHSVTGKNRICYALATPKERVPADAKRDPAYAFISERPAERVRNEISFVMGFEVGGAEAEKPTKDSKEKKKTDSKDKKPQPEAAGATATVGDAEFDLLPKGSDLWVKNPAQESQLIDEMRKGVQLKIKSASKKGGASLDTYSLTGFKQAIDRALKDCPES
jgi:hypothetical protein